MLTERTTTLFVSIFYFQKCQTRDCTMIAITEQFSLRVAQKRAVAHATAPCFCQSLNSASLTRNLARPRLAVRRMRLSSRW